jgi:hypothetical protein
MRWGRGLPDDMLEPCGTLAAYRRHLRRGDPVDRDCRQAVTRGWHDRVAGGYVKPASSRHFRVHLALVISGTALCGRRLAAVTDDPGEVTCRHCAAVLRRHLAAAGRPAGERSRAA